MPFWRRRREEPADDSEPPPRPGSIPRRSSPAGSPTRPTSTTPDDGDAGRAAAEHRARPLPSEPEPPAGPMTDRAARRRCPSRAAEPSRRPTRRSIPIAFAKAATERRRSTPASSGRAAGSCRALRGFLGDRTGEARPGTTSRRRSSPATSARPSRSTSSSGPAAGATRAAPRRPSAPSSPRCSSPRDVDWTPAPVGRRRPGGHPRRRRQRDRQDHDDRQARQPLRRGGPIGHPRRRGHVPRRRHRPAPDLGGPRRRRRSSPTRPGADPGAVVYDALDAAVARGADLVIADTAGRLHTKSNLMDELAKIRRIIDKRLPGRRARDALRARRDDRPERPRPGEGLPRGGRADRDRPDQARLDRPRAASSSPSRTRSRSRSASSGWGSGVGDLLPFDPDAFVAALFA